ncbi:hypothetical protein EV383_2942 [Pseudonocardia sediminis]|uniref:Uncharacterized protein n=1 Tax=Pseudonocardia sediminis TaxID=1397368 RepID=A0A4Q7UY62_PSEST|nr:hypothetical protein [Pseudonocardia sediminis]RZT86054.1 hypothetical protein EV383_2942 [Pseudonocardia sediminis]
MRRGEVWTYDPVLGTPGRSRRRLGERVHVASTEEMDAVDAALRAAQDL